MYSRILTGSLYGLAGEPSWAEVDISTGSLPAFNIVGLANQPVKEAKERTKAAIKNCGFSFPDDRVTVNLTPANRKKEGSHYDLPIALGILACRNDIPQPSENTAFIGELNLGGHIRPVEGVLPMLIGLQRSGVKRVVIPKANLEEAKLVKGLDILPAERMDELCEMMKNGDVSDFVTAEGCGPGCVRSSSLDFADIRGQGHVKRAAQVAAAGMHGLLMIGPPGVGKSMVGKRIPGILPPLSYQEQLDVSRIYSVAGELNSERPMINERPFRAPHHSISATALVGGGAHPKPGEISLAHNGVLFLDELPEFAPHTLETMRQPLEDGCVSINRIGGRIEYPCRFMLVAAMNPCRCGYYGDPVHPCTCTESDRKKYISKISGPLLDRIDLHVSLERTLYGEISQNGPDRIDSGLLREGVMRAFEMQRKRYEGLSINYNSQLGPAMMDRFCHLDNACEKLMAEAFNRWSLSARSYHRILKLARTEADIDGRENIEEKDVLEALGYRMQEKYFK